MLLYEWLTDKVRVVQILSDLFSQSTVTLRDPKTTF